MSFVVEMFQNLHFSIILYVSFVLEVWAWKYANACQSQTPIAIEHLKYVRKIRNWKQDSGNIFSQMIRLIAK